jgi:hypothetical protein
MDELRELLNEWDLIGVRELSIHNDEHDCLLGPLLTRLAAGAGVNDVGLYLRDEIRDHLGWTPSNTMPMFSRAGSWPGGWARSRRVIGGSRDVRPWRSLIHPARWEPYPRRMVQPGDIVLDLGQTGGQILVTLGDLSTPRLANLPGHGWRHVEIHVEAAPFAGVIQSIFTEADITEYRQEAARFAAGAEHARFGGDRAPLITLDRHGDNMEVFVTPSGDDPWPQLRFLIFGSAG